MINIEQNGVCGQQHGRDNPGSCGKVIYVKGATGIVFYKYEAGGRPVQEIDEGTGKRQ